MRYYEGHWYYSPMAREFEYIPSGNYEEGMDLSHYITIRLPWEVALKLLPVMEDNGILKPKLDEKVHSEDLKITHRLIDLLDKAIS